MRLGQFYLKVGLFALLLMFCILFGVSLASSGTQRIEGTSVSPPSKSAVQGAVAQAQGQATAIQPSASPVAKSAAKTQPTPTPAPTKEPIADHDNSLNRVGNKLGDLLQITMHHGIKLFVSLFDAVLGKG
ncbi:hypothetical protein [Paenibacillus whitsoniae]|uniref:DUF3679 domain-containing protein n=1 Tax=Paenibacillus whitsoniae TaxID=2496558 RepID=A0A430JBX4_9BACL|nr:hypothetical protein [Paenibacillus whitsoniae]RTE08507.1 hypothetical protein EJQ19_16875 [Paenibacillus whitsoniae]